MIVYVGKRFSSAIRGSAIRDVVCEKCTCTYSYELVRYGAGSGSAPYYVGQDSAKQRAMSHAQRRLDRALRTGIDPVICPACTWLQASMVREMKRRRLQGLVVVAIFTSAALALLSF